MNRSERTKERRGEVAGGEGGGGEGGRRRRGEKVNRGHRRRRRSGSRKIGVALEVQVCTSRVGRDLL